MRQQVPTFPHEPVWTLPIVRDGQVIPRKAPCIHLAEFLVTTTTFTRLQLATRIHFALLRNLGEGIDVGRMLRQRDYADEALNVCRSLDDDGLFDLANRFEEATAAENAKVHMDVAAKAARAALALIPRRGPVTPQEMPWSQQTSGFGLTHTLEAEPPTPPVRRFSVSGWLGFGADSQERH